MPELTLTLTENLKLQLSPGLVASYDIQETEWVYSGTNTHTFTYLLTCPGPTWGIDLQRGSGRWARADDLFSCHFFDRHHA